jgi:hypothetical protein
MYFFGIVYLSLPVSLHLHPDRPCWPLLLATPPTAIFVTNLCSLLSSLLPFSPCCLITASSTDALATGDLFGDLKTHSPSLPPLRHPCLILTEEDSMAHLTLLLTLPIWLSPAAHLVAPPLDKPQPPLGEPSLSGPFLSPEDIAVCCRTLPQTLIILTAKANFDFLRGKST